MPSGKKVKIVLDTNTIISALLSKDGNPAKVLEIMSNDILVNYISDQIKKEVSDVLSRPKITKHTTKHERQYLIEYIESMSQHITPKQKHDVIKEDPADNRILECAVEAKADYIITGDTHLLKLKEFKGIEIVNSREFLKKNQ